MRFQDRFIPFSSLRYSTQAFIDFCLPECSPKKNYALIGPGVSQSLDQPVNLREAHGFQVGGVSMGPGKVNPPHLHFTCEVFICAKGTWQIMWGFNPEIKTIEIGAGDIVAIPTWIYRGFKNLGNEDGFMFTALGRDDTGGILWGPDTIDAAKRHGVYLTKAHRIIDTRQGVKLPLDADLFEPMTRSEIAGLRDWSVEQMQERCIAFEKLHWTAEGLLDSRLPNCGSAIAPVIGYGMCEKRDHLPRPMNPIGLSMEWIKVPPGGGISRHRIASKQVLIVFRGSLSLRLDEGEHEEYRLSGTDDGWDVFSIPANTWRELRASAEGELVVLSLLASDDRKFIDWDQSTVTEAAAMGLIRDADGYIAHRRFVGRA